MSEQNISPQLVSESQAPYQFIVIGAGLATTIGTLVGVYYLNNAADVNAMGWYLDYVVPLGALLVGLVAGSGYGIASWFTGTKIRRRLLVTIIVLQIFAYGGAQYEIFASRGPLYLPDSDHPLTFPQYFDFEARNFAWKEDNGKTGEALGAAGYFFRILEVVGFALGALIVPAALFRKPYCEKCQAYMRTRELARIGASIPARKVKKSDAAGQQEYARQQDEAYRSAMEKLKAVWESGAAGDVAGYRAALATCRGGKNGSLKKLPRRLILKLVRCKRCESEYLNAQVSTGHGKKAVTVDVKKIDLPQGFAGGAS